MRWIYLHGFASGPGSKKARFFGEKFRAAGLDFQIPDLAEGGFENLTITGQLRVVERAAGGGPVSLIGSSMGGYLAALYAARHPHEVERLILLAPALGFARRWTAAMPAAELGEWKRTGYRLIYHYGDGAERRIGYGLIADGLRYEDFPAVTQPALLFHGTRDTVVPHSISEEFAALRPNLRLVLVDSDHELVSAFEQTWKEVEKFLWPTSLPTSSPGSAPAPGSAGRS